MPTACSSPADAAASSIPQPAGCRRAAATPAYTISRALRSAALRPRQHTQRFTDILHLRQLQAVRTSKTVPMLLWNDALREAEPPHLAEPLRQIVHVP